MPRKHNRLATMEKCPYCQRPFKSHNSNKKFCSERCKQAAYRARHKAGK